MRTAYRTLALLICLGVLVQAAAIAFGWFDVISDSEAADVVLNEDYEGNAGHAVHGIVGMTVMPLLGLLLLLTSFFTKLPGASKWAGFVLLSIVAQVLLAFVSFGVPIVGVLHGVNAFVIFGLAMMAATRMKASSAAHVGADRETAAV